MSKATEITEEILKVLEARDVTAATKNEKLAERLDRHVGANGKLTERYRQFQKFDQAVNLALLMALTEFLVSKKEFKEVTEKLDTVWKELDEI